MVKDPYFNEKTILILDKTEKSDNDHTWSYWEKGAGAYDDILWGRWQQGYFYDTSKKYDFNLGDYSYKTLKSSDFYKYAKSQLALPNITWITEEVVATLEQSNSIEIKTVKNSYQAQLCFDSRLSEQYNQSKNQHLHLLQHFKGYLIKTKNPHFDPSHFTVMDYRLRHGDGTSFTYVLPKSSTEAMIEFTLFDQQLLDQHIYDQYLNKYISEIIGIKEFEIIETEYGVIPMSTYPFQKDHQSLIYKIGTAGGWVRPSTGYSFHNAIIYSQIIIENLKNNNNPVSGIYEKLTAWMDKILLSVLEKENHIGVDIFKAIYSQKDLRSVFSFLDPHSALPDKLSMIFSVPWSPFLRGAIRWITGQIK